ncbi:MAG: hypothetical protein ABH851_06770 [Methanobacteriota archaeon]
MVHKGPLARQAEYGVTLVDVGGTKQLVMVVGVDREGNLMTDTVLAKREVPTPVKNLPEGDPNVYFKATAATITEVQDEVTSQLGIKTLPLVYMGSPGRLVGGKIAPGSAGNLGSKFDGLNPSKELSRELGQDTHVVNDAIAQMGSGVFEFLKFPYVAEQLRGQKVCYIGPGTGLGGGFGRISDELTLDYHTDGHIYDIQIEGFTFGSDENSTLTLNVAGVNGPVSIPSRFAEDVLSGRAVGQIARAIDRHLIEQGKDTLFIPLVEGYGKMSADEVQAALNHDNNESPVDAKLIGVNLFDHPEGLSDTHFKAFPAGQFILEFEAEMLAKLISCVYEGRIEKATEDAQWPQPDRELVVGTTNFFIGGSVGTKGEFGKGVRDHAQKHLKARHPETEFNLWVIKGSEEAGALGAAAFHKKEDILHAIELVDE